MKILRGERGLAPAMLILIVVWALAAVMMLTGTLIAAGQIKDSVAIIKPEVSDIGTDTDLIALAAKTNNIAGQIRVAAVPLSAQLDDTLEAAKGIDTTAKSILGKAGDINETADIINGNVKLINTTVGSIGSNVSGIGTSVRSINGNARSINASARSISSNTSSINASARSIDSRGETILRVVNSINPAVSGINNRAVVIQNEGKSLGGDLSKVLGLVGASRGPNNISGIANSIDCSTLLNLLGRTQGCNR